ncbi:MAG: NAD(P)H-dependent oxidoreductase [Gammaproteobacteria bacterium]|jgi:chromate reductase|nr:NAD(P)H-dependent oxidoreductase [Gammaproteobacteria bacterium]
MSKEDIAVIVGSLRRESFNRRFASALIKLGPPEFSFRHVEIGDLPLYNQDDDDNPASQVKRLRDEIRSAAGVIFVTPEYNRSIPGVLKNVLDHGSRPYGQSVWNGKPAGIIGVTPGTIGTACAQQHLRTILAYLNMPTMGQPEAFLRMREDLIGADGNIGAESREFVQKWMDSFTAWINRHTG